MTLKIEKNHYNQSMANISDNQIIPITNHDASEKALARLSAGRLVAIPTETVYGLAADATNGKAVARIFQAKGRPQFNPLICHVNNLEMAEEIAYFNTTAHLLAKKFWPGPLTLVLPLKHSASTHPLVTAGLDTIGIRCPQGFARDLIAKLGRPLAAPSANKSGKVSPTTAFAVKDSLGNHVDMILDAGSCTVGLESTIVQVEDDNLMILRPGSVTVDDLKSQSFVNKVSDNIDNEIKAPGMLKSHYAPNAVMRLNSVFIRKGDALLAFGPQRISDAHKACCIENLSPKGDLVEAAANLFSMIAKLDKSGTSMIAVEPIPLKGIGVAINDRLTRAAAPRGAIIE